MFSHRTGVPTFVLSKRAKLLIRKKPFLDVCIFRNTGMAVIEVTIFLCWRISYRYGMSVIKVETFR